MSSKKKARQRKRREKEQEQSRGRFSPVTLFMLGIGAVVILTVVGAMVLGVNSGPGDPPRPGAVWSQEHGHWH